MRIDRVLLSIAVIMILIASISILATSMNVSVKGVAAGETRVEFFKVKIIGVRDYITIRGAVLTLTAADVVVSSDRSGTYIVVLTVVGDATTTATRTATFSGTTTIAFQVTVRGMNNRDFHHRVQVYPA